MPRLLFVVDDDSYFCSHRLHLGRAARRAGYEVSVATRVARHGSQIEQEGFTLYPMKLRRGFRSPINDLRALFELIRLYRRVRPDIVHHVALKMVLFGGMAARLTHTRAKVHAITGLGHLFHADSTRNKVLRAVLTPLLRWVLAPPRSQVLLQNQDDARDLVRAGLISDGQTVIIRGAGVDTDQFRPSPEPPGDPVAILPARIIREKGVVEFLDAARLLKQKGVRLKCVLVGGLDELNPSGFTQEQVLRWIEEGVIECWGHRDDMEQVYASSHMVVLPSYHEGLPKVLLEGAACGRPLIATRVRGCQEVVREGENGLLVPPQNAAALAEALLTLAQDRALRLRMGARGREIAAQEFGQGRIAAETLAVYRQVQTPCIVS
jgi:glycosyltransferase involved in cell wall biosynthesis